MKSILITGASGFFGSLLKRRLLTEGFRCTNIDPTADTDRHCNLISIQGDIRDNQLLTKLFEKERFTAVFHCAALLAHDTIDDNALWTSNVDGTRNIAEACRRYGVSKLIFISTNWLWASNPGHDVKEDEPPNPVDLYSRSKLAAEQVLEEYTQDLNVIILRCPAIVDSGRPGLLAILFEFIEDNKKVWVVGDGSNRYQLLYAHDLATACIQCLDYHHSDLFHIGSDHVVSLRKVYEAVIEAAGTRARVAQLPKALTIAAMQLAHKLKLSPLGPFHYRMIAEDFIFDTTHIRSRLNWLPTLTNEQMMIEAFRSYKAQRAEIQTHKDVSTAHSRPTSMGVIRLLKWIS